MTPLNAITGGTAGAIGGLIDNGVDSQRLKNATNIAEDNYQVAKANYGTNALNTGSQSSGNDSNVSGSNDATNNSLDQLLSWINGSGGQRLSASEQMAIDSNNARLLREDRPDIAKYGKEAVQQRADIDERTDYRQQGFNQSNMQLSDQLNTGQKKLDSTIRRDEGADDFTYNMNYKNQDYQNTRSLNAQQSYDNENQRKYNSLDNLVKGVTDIYTSSAPANLIASLFNR